MAEEAGALDSKQTYDLEVVRLQLRYSFRSRVLAVLKIPAFGIPILAAWPVAAELSGQDTTVTLTASLAVTLTATLSGAGAYLALWRKSKRQTEELQRLRARCRRLEAELERRGGELERSR